MFSPSLAIGFHIMPPLPYLTPAVLLTNDSTLVKVALLSPHPTPHTPEQQVMSRFFFQSMVSGLNLYPRGEGAALVNSKLVSLAFYASEEGGSRSELSVSSLKQRISLMIPRNEKEKSPVVVQARLHSVKYKLHTFNVTENASTVHIRLGWQVNVDVEVYVKKGSEPKPSESVFDFNKTLQCGGNNSANSLNSSEHISELFFSNHDLNWTAAGTYYALLRYKENVSLPEEEKAKMDSDGSIPYNFSVYTSMCQYYDEKQKGWSTNGTEVS